MSVEYEAPKEVKDEATHTDKNATITTHPAYGMIVFNRASSSHPITLFGSSIQHKQIITMELRKSELHRDLNNDWYMGKDLICSIEMSQTQFAEAITGFGQGFGVPCTIQYANKKRVPDIKGYEHKQDRYNREFSEELETVSKDMDNGIKRAEEILSGTPKKAEKEELIDIIKRFNSLLRSRLPFLQEQFAESVDKTVVEAKGEVEAFLQNKINKLGLKEIQKEEMRKMLLDNK